MKKILLLLVGFVVSFAVGAQDYSGWYVNVPHTANDFEDNGLNPNNEGISTHFLAIGTGYFKIKVWDGSSDHWYTTSGEIPQSQWVSLGDEKDSNADGMTIKNATENQNFTVKYNCATNQVIVIPEGGQVEPPVTTDNDFYVIGPAFGGWNLKDANCKMTPQGGNVYTYVAANGISGLWKINNGSWDKSFGPNSNGDAPELNKLYEMADNGNFSSDFKGKVTIKFTYVPNGVSTLLLETETTPIVPGADNAIYMHFKYDLEEYGKDGKNTIPYCEFFNTNNNDKKNQQMTLESDRYSIWKAPLADGDETKYNAVRFYFAKPDKDNQPQQATYSSYSFTNDNNNTVAYFDQENWTKYIYATSAREEDNKEYAVQSYLSYADFKALDQLDIANGGRRNLYLVGWGNGEGATIRYYDENGVEQGMTNTLTEALKLKEDGGCFYLTFVKPAGGSFKVSWLSVADAVAALPKNYGKTHSQREWATFDLGLIGVDKDYEYPEGAEKLNYNRYDGINGKVYMKRNISVRYMNYNQADWVLPTTIDELPEVGFKRWLVIDTHFEEGNPDETCKTATITSFDPNPSVKVKVSEVTPRDEELDDATAKMMHVDCLNAASDNGHIFMKKVNYAVGVADIIATNISYVQNADFSRVYTLYVNDREVGHHSGTNLQSLRIDYFPLSFGENSMGVRAKYTDSKTGLSFHSRTGKGAVETDLSFEAPKEKELKGRYVFERMDDEGKQFYGIYVDGLDCEIDNVKGYHAYSDFSFDCGSSARFVDANHPIHTIVPEIVPAWSGWNKGDDWSTKLKEERGLAPVFIHDAVHVDDFSHLETKTVKCIVYAVYPFMYNPDATFEVNAPSNAPARAPRAQDFTGFKVFNSSVPTEMNLLVTTDGAVSGVENVEGAEADDAPVEYWTISGVRVAGEPAPGIYLRRQGDKVAKVVIR